MHTHTSAKMSLSVFAFQLWVILSCVSMIRHEQICSFLLSFTQLNQFLTGKHLPSGCVKATQLFFRLHPPVKCTSMHFIINTTVTIILYPVMERMLCKQEPITHCEITAESLIPIYGCFRDWQLYYVLFDVAIKRLCIVSDVRTCCLAEVYFSRSGVWLLEVIAVTAS